ncbi:extracellular solute-binding protein [Nocardioides stalactiti]|uniref:extracellular solute-binding protein n=1 Tax=Nocardioides stalactiti TaxID=2755356 RepID=UPI00160151AA|nr:extracellular solute-binding protein [Nocardioides stalactiti]
MRNVTLPAALVAVLVLAAGCGGSEEPADGVTTIQVWAHDGTPAERAVLEKQVAEFDAGRDDVTVDLQFWPEGDYNDRLQAAVAAGTEPDVFEVDGPLIDGYLYQGVVARLDDLIEPSTQAAQLPSLASQGTRDGHLYSVGLFDSGLGLYADRRALRRARVSWPTSIEEAWTVEEFARVLRRLADGDEDGKVLDVKLNYGVGEWLTYGFAPLVASAGGRLIDPETLDPLGELDGPATRRALEVARSWASYLDPNGDDEAFTSRRVALSWVGHWTYRDYEAALGDDLLVLPLPDLGNGTKSGQGSWSWSIATGDEQRQESGAALLEYLLADEQVLEMADANGAVPGTTSALASSELYTEDGPLRLFAEQLLRSCGNLAPGPVCVTVPRPSTPGYAFLSGQFALAVSAALDGRDAGPALEDAAQAVADDVAANAGYR